MYQTLTHNKTEPLSNFQVERYLTTILLQLEIPSKNKGFFFTKEAAKIAYFNPMSRFNINDQIFKLLADQYGTTCSKIERSIRHALSIATTQKKMKSFEDVFHIKDNFSLLHPSVGEFISLLAESVNFVDINNL